MKMMIPPKTATIPTSDPLREEIQSRREAEEWGLQRCPCCQARASVLNYNGRVKISCFRWGCRQVEAKSMADAAYLWNQPDFRQAQRP